MRLKTGKKPHVPDERDFLFERYRTGSLPKRPRTFGHEKVLAAGGWKMLGNGPDDSVVPGFRGAGNCVLAGACHETILWLIEGGMDPAKALALFTGKTAIADYSAVTGYVIGDDSTDQGTEVRTALKYRQKTGIRDVHGRRHKIGAYVAIDPQNLDHILEAMYIFGAAGIGVSFPQSAMDQFDAGQPWSYVASSPDEGGHYIPGVAERDKFEVITWARIQKVLTAFLQHKADEAWLILSPEMLRNGKTIEGFDMAALSADLNALKGA